MSDDEFWSSTPAQIAAIAERWQVRRELAEFGPAVICHTVCSLMGAKDIKLENFMPSRNKKENKGGQPAAPPPEDMLHFLAAKFGGVVTHGR